jgi:hypothetical protein
MIRNRRFGMLCASGLILAWGISLCAAQRMRGMAQPVGAGGAAPTGTTAKGGLHIPQGKNVNFTYNMTDGDGFRWDVQYNGNIGQGTSNVYSGGLYCQIAGTNIGSTGQGWLNEAGDELEIGPYQYGTMKVYRRIKVYKDRGLARWMDIFENTAAADQNLQVQIYSYLNYGMGTVTTTSGNNTFGEKDWAFITQSMGGNNLPSLLHIVCDKRSKLRPTLNLQNNQIYVGYNIPVPASKTVVLCYFESQSNSIDNQQKLLKQFQLSKLLKDLAPAVRKLIVNFPASTGSLDDIELERNEINDGVFLVNGDPIFGNVTNEKFVMETAFGSLTIPAKQLIGMVAGGEEGTLKAILNDGQIICGRLPDEKLSIDIPSMGTLKVPMDRVRQLAYRISKERPEEVPFNGPFMLLRTGDRVAFEAASLQLSFRTKHGTVPLEGKDLMRILLDNPGNGVHRAVFLNGSSLAGFLQPERFTASLRLGSKPEITRDMVQQFEFASEEALDETLTCAVLTNGDKVYGELVENQFKLATDYGEMTVMPGSIRAIGFSQAQSGRAMVALWDGSVLRGQLDQGELEFQILPGPKIKLPPGECVSITRTQALPPKQVREQVEKLVSRLGSETFKDRQEATDVLLKMGPTIVPLLRKYLDTKDPEVRQRVEDIIEKLGGNKAAPPPTPGGPARFINFNGPVMLQCG